jgi:hypothetical protein
MQSLITTTLTAGVLALAAPSTAVTVVMQYTGHVTRGIDVAGLFGTAGADLSGSGFVGTARFDMPFPQATQFETHDPFEAQLSINGHDHVVPFVPASPPYYQTVSLAGFFAFGTGGSTRGYSILSAAVFMPGMHLFAWVPADNLVESNGTIGGPTDINGNFNDAGDALALHIERFDMSPPPALPEPASWALMVSGFGMVGATLRRQRPRHASSIASV